MLQPMWSFRQGASKNHYHITTYHNLYTSCAEQNQVLTPLPASSFNLSSTSTLVSFMFNPRPLAIKLGCLDTHDSSHLITGYTTSASH